jgi:hypothetical protein
VKTAILPNLVLELDGRPIHLWTTDGRVLYFTLTPANFCQRNVLGGTSEHRTITGQELLSYGYSLYEVFPQDILLSDTDAVHALEIQKHAQAYSPPSNHCWSGYQVLLAAREGIVVGRKLQAIENRASATIMASLTRERDSAEDQAAKLAKQLATAEERIKLLESSQGDHTKLHRRAQKAEAESAALKADRFLQDKRISDLQDELRLSETRLGLLQREHRYLEIQQCYPGARKSDYAMQTQNAALKIELDAARAKFKALKTLLNQ